MTTEQANAFAREWIDAWNARDLDRVLSHYTDDFEMSSPFIVQLMGERSGQLIGKDKIRHYWQTALERNPGLHFELRDVCLGAASVALTYVNHTGRLVTEVLFFNPAGKVFRAAAHYGPL